MKTAAGVVVVVEAAAEDHRDDAWACCSHYRVNFKY
jgi:hypothetical protein